MGQPPPIKAACQRCKESPAKHLWGRAEANATGKGSQPFVLTAGSFHGSCPDGDHRHVFGRSSVTGVPLQCEIAAREHVQLTAKREQLSQRFVITLCGPGANGSRVRNIHELNSWGGTGSLGLFSST
ncbi:defensin 2 [Platysternon megacephalum]|uniref:Defensin 2 n=1 Tax=Platysternon megacephalum TaxID=55544 RepID=A0A4D9EER9_9SAUR|nr:defensin 2 [Platysternon megacephalum]